MRDLTPWAAHPEIRLPRPGGLLRRDERGVIGVLVAVLLSEYAVVPEPVISEAKPLSKVL